MDNTSFELARIAKVLEQMLETMINLNLNITSINDSLDSLNDSIDGVNETLDGIDRILPNE